MADSLAREAVLAVPTYEAPSTFQQTTAKIREWVHEKWIKAWDESDKARRVWQHMRRPDRDSPWWKLPRAEQSIIAQCRTGHCPVGAYFARLRQNYNDRCRHCGESEENVEHILRECPQLRQLRGRLSVEPDLYGNAEVLHRTAKFLTEALREG